MCRRRTLSRTAIDDDGWLRVASGVLRRAALRTGRLESSDDHLGLLIRDLAKDDVLVVEPAGHDGGDEELGAVPGAIVVSVESSKAAEPRSSASATYVLGPALAMDSRYGRSCLSLKFSSGNFSP